MTHHINKINKKIVIVIAIVVIVGALSFFSGVKYIQAKSGFSRSGMNGQMGPGGAGMNRQSARGNTNTNRVLGSSVIGQVISQDENGVTVKLNDGGSRVILIATSTQVMKSIQVKRTDLVAGTNVTITGGTNADGSISAQMIQIRAAVATSTVR